MIPTICNCSNSFQWTLSPLQYTRFGHYFKAFQIIDFNINFVFSFFKIIFKTFVEVVMSNYMTYNINQRKKECQNYQRMSRNIENEEVPSLKYSLSYLVITGMQRAWWSHWCFLYYESKIWEVERWVINHSEHVTQWNMETYFSLDDYKS